MEGEYQLERRQEFTATVGEREIIQKPVDNLTLEGDFERPQPKAILPLVERPKPHKPSDNLKPEGEFFGERTTTQVVKGERAEIHRHVDNLKTEGVFIGMYTKTSHFWIINKEKR